jgi:hypothetical protein
MVATPCLIEQPRSEEKVRRFELGVPGSAAAPLDRGLLPAAIAFPEPKAATEAWTEGQRSGWDILVAMMWRGVL